MNQDGEELRKQALAFLLAADIQHRANLQAWMMMLVDPTESQKLSLQERYDAALQMAVAQRDQGQIAQLITNLCDLDFDVSTDPDFLDSTFLVVQQEMLDFAEEEERRPATDWSVIEKFNRLVDE